MQKRDYPYTAWRLTRTFQVLELELVASGFPGSAFDRTESGRTYPVDELHPSREAAIVEGEKRLKKLAAEISKRRATLKRGRNELQSQR